MTTVGSLPFCLAEPSPSQSRAFSSEIGKSSIHAAIPLASTVESESLRSLLSRITSELLTKTHTLRPSVLEGREASGFFPPLLFHRCLLFVHSSEAAGENPPGSPSSSRRLVLDPRPRSTCGPAGRARSASPRRKAPGLPEAPLLAKEFRSPACLPVRSPPPLLLPTVLRAFSARPPQQVAHGFRGPQIVAGPRSPPQAPHLTAFGETRGGSVHHALHLTQANVRGGILGLPA